MTTASPALRVVAWIAVLAGYCTAKAGALLRAASSISSSTRLRVVEAEGIRLRVPDDWGELERDVLARLVLHNRPPRFRIDGDAVWYSMAVELRILPGRHAKPRNAEAMTTTTRYIETPGGVVTLELAIANGVGPRQRAVAQKVLDTAMPARSDVSARQKTRFHEPR